MSLILTYWWHNTYWPSNASTFWAGNLYLHFVVYKVCHFSGPHVAEAPPRNGPVGFFLGPFLGPFLGDHSWILACRSSRSSLCFFFHLLYPSVVHFSSIPRVFLERGCPCGRLRHERASCCHHSWLNSHRMGWCTAINSSIHQWVVMCAYSRVFAFSFEASIHGTLTSLQFSKFKSEPASVRRQRRRDSGT